MSEDTQGDQFQLVGNIRYPKSSVAMTDGYQGGIRSEPLRKKSLLMNSTQASESTLAPPIATGTQAAVQRRRNMCSSAKSAAERGNLGLHHECNVLKQHK